MMTDVQFGRLVLPWVWSWKYFHGMVAYVPIFVIATDSNFVNLFYECIVRSAYGTELSKEAYALTTDRGSNKRVCL